MGEHENIPRKKPKFVNFVKNIMRNRARPHSIDKTWELFEQALKPAAPPAEAMEVEKAELVNGKSDKKADSQETNGKEDTPEKENVGGKKEKKKKKKKDNKLEETEEETKTSRKRKSSDVGENEDDETTKEEESPVKKAKFDWDEVITACLKEKDGNEMKLVKLKKKCLKEYFSAHEGSHKTKEEIGAKFDKKVNKRSYKVLKDRIKLVGVEEEKKSEEEEEVMQGAASKPEGWQSAPDPKPSAISFNKWEGADMGSDAQTEKFRRLMGIKAAPKPQEVSSKWGRDDKKMLRELEQGFEKARETHFGGRSFTQ